MKRLGVLIAMVASLNATGAVARAPRAFDPLSYFAKATTSSGTEENAFGRRDGRLTGETHGRRERDGSVSFDQTISFDDGSVRRRTWRIVRTGPNSIEATGSDLVGVAHGEIDGRTLHLTSTVRADAGNPFSDVDFDQTLSLEQDGRTLDNLSTVRKLGFVVMRIHETFRRR